MSTCIVEELGAHGHIDQDQLATAFARQYALEENRGYGATARLILRSIHEGRSWRDVSPSVLGGMGSMGNGGAMRSAPIGAFFGSDTDAVIEQARLSAEITHAHVEGQAGAIAVALAAAFFAATRDWDRASFFEFVLARTPDGETRARIAQARDLPASYSVETVTSAVGNGVRLTSQDTVPFCLWVVSRSPKDFEEAMWTAVSGGGDIDTNCAIVGGILGASPSAELPLDWIARREPLRISTPH
jgi:ADP-ribosylglycohydrolase